MGVSLDVVALIVIIILVFGSGPWYPYSHRWGYSPFIVMMVVLIAYVMFFSGVVHAAEAPSGPTVSELVKGPESLWSFLSRLPGSQEAQIFYALTLAGALGMFGSFWLKWGKGQIEGNPLTYWIVHPQSTVLTLGTFFGLIITALTTGVFESPGGDFVGWWNVLYIGATTGFGVDFAANKGQTKVWTDAERKAAQDKQETPS